MSIFEYNKEEEEQKLRKAEYEAGIEAGVAEGELKKARETALSLAEMGPFAEQMLRSFNCSKLFIGVDGIDPDFGLTTTNMLEASLNRAMIDAAQKVVVLADSSKFGRRGFSKICDLESVDRIITDNRVQPLYLDRLRERGIEVTVVEV